MTSGQGTTAARKCLVCILADLQRGRAPVCRRHTHHWSARGRLTPRAAMLLRSLTGLAEAQALAHKYRIKQLTLLALMVVIELRSEVASVVEGQEAVFQPPWHLPREKLLLPPIRDGVPHVAPVEAHARALVVPDPVANREGVRQHHARRHVPGLLVQLRIVRATVGGGQEAHAPVRVPAARGDVEQVVRRGRHHVDVGAEQLRAIRGAPPPREVALAPLAHRSEHVRRRAHRLDLDLGLDLVPSMVLRLSITLASASVAAVAAQRLRATSP
eukprot:CAMPEP_0179238138 /NCGR_PEP_ID=MMETSP0797-20121207/14797_1 /TAXON_ID=47934 /ORGANISM="Dinophysis acuminata, Strain DAEP01" /LENGTH=271 /DNA_ID=CAMNT_0020945433 /DNA_START=555 /DNA_END=1371 /DNA_ORIENTATION=-